MGSRDNTAQGILHDAAHRLYQCSLLSKSHTVLQDTRKFNTYPANVENMVSS